MKKQVLDAQFAFEFGPTADPVMKLEQPRVVSLANARVMNSRLAALQRLKDEHVFDVSRYERRLATIRD